MPPRPPAPGVPMGDVPNGDVAPAVPAPAALPNALPAPGPPPNGDLPPVAPPPNVGDWKLEPPKALDLPPGWPVLGWPPPGFGPCPLRAPGCAAPPGAPGA